MNFSNKPAYKACIMLEFPCPKGLVMGREVTELELQALADDELDEDEKRAVMAAVLKDPLLLERLDEIITRNNLIRDCWHPSEDETNH